jgi:deoxyribonuclease-1-like protein
MPKQVLILLVIAAAAGGVYFFLNYEVQTQHEPGKPASWRIVPKGVPAAASAEPPADGAARPTIRIASYQLGRLDEAKLANRRVSDVLIRLLPRFDLIALQGVRGKNQGVLVRLVEQLNAASGRTYDFATCPTQQRDALEHYSAFLFDRGRIEVDRTTVHFVEDRLSRFRIKPLVGAFRVRGPNMAEAFTFTLINVETDPDHASAEVDLLADAFRAVRDYYRSEDDIILLGDLESDDQHLGQLSKLLGVTALLSGVPTTTRGAHLLDNILLDRRATSEFTGRVEVVDMMRDPDFELTMPGALEVSEHLPVWAEFSIYEGGQPGHVPAGPIR